MLECNCLSEELGNSKKGLEPIHISEFMKTNFNSIEIVICEV